jgi:hypothetical protein
MNFEEIKSELKPIFEAAGAKQIIYGTIDVLIDHVAAHPIYPLAHITPPTISFDVAGQGVHEKWSFGVTIMAACLPDQDPTPIHTTALAIIRKAVSALRDEPSDVFFFNAVNECSIIDPTFTDLAQGLTCELVLTVITCY